MPSAWTFYCGYLEQAKAFFSKISLEEKVTHWQPCGFHTRLQHVPPQNPPSSFLPMAPILLPPFANSPKLPRFADFLLDQQQPTQWWVGELALFLPKKTRTLLWHHQWGDIHRDYPVEKYNLQRIFGPFLVFAHWTGLLLLHHGCEG